MCFEISSRKSERQSLPASRHDDDGDAVLRIPRSNFQVTGDDFGVQEREKDAGNTVCMPLRGEIRRMGKNETDGTDFSSNYLGSLWRESVCMIYEQVHLQRDDKIFGTRYIFLPQKIYNKWDHQSPLPTKQLQFTSAQSRRSSPSPTLAESIRYQR